MIVNNFDCLVDATIYNLFYILCKFEVVQLQAVIFKREETSYAAWLIKSQRLIF